ncbi:uncharacterized protein LOC134226518 [Armigeres subalbatus]|uniref:uncharacterized protein LOC134226518 n=1 Tax=Armigeres subalbatus TaxID=124917 RepID=UPI002ED4A470
MSSSSSCCCIPGCSNRHIEWTTPLPRDEVLRARWSEAIRTGTGGLSPIEARVCNAHFVDKGAATASNDGYGRLPAWGTLEYQEPTLFYRNDIPLQVTWCRLCLRHGTLESMFNIHGRSSITEQSLAWMANKHFGVWLNAQSPSETHYFCEKCKLRLEATHTFWKEIQQSDQKYRMLQEKMSIHRLSLNSCDSVHSYPTETYPSNDKATQDGIPLPSTRPFDFEPFSNSPLSTKQNFNKMFAVVEFTSGTPTIEVLAVPTSWIKDNLLMWPKRLNGEAIYALRKEGTHLDDSIETENFPVVVLQHFTDYYLAEIAVQDILKQRNRDSSSRIDLPNANRDVLTYTAFRNEIHNLKANLDSLVQAAVEKGFRSKSLRNNAAQSRQASELVMTIQAEVERHKKISNASELDDFNTRLADPSVGRKYLDYFAKLIHPNNCSSGDNAMYTIVDYLFTRDFWNHFTWTGINRSQKSSRGFREFANVTQLLLNIVLLGDSTYDAPRLEQFCRTKLFRYCKSRSAGKQLRKSTCRPGRKRPAEDSRSSDGGGEVEPALGDGGTTDSNVVCKVEVFNNDMWQQPETENTGEFTDEMM